MTGQVDRLSDILSRISFNAEVFFSGNLCGIQSLGGTEGGHLHLLQSGVLTILTNEGHKVRMDTPSVIFIPGPTEHRIMVKESENARLVCATVNFDSANNDLLIASLPQFLYYPATGQDNVSKVANWIFDEAFADSYGKQAMVDRLTDIFLIEILRDVLSNGTTLHGVLSAVSHPHLAKVLEAIHASPERNWSIEEMANVALMSRSKFAAVFKENIGRPPNEYITELRLTLAQDLLKKKKPVNIVANEVGYEHGSALARVFKKKLGLTPKEWIQKHNVSRAKKLN